MNSYRYVLRIGIDRFKFVIPKIEHFRIPVRKITVSVKLNEVPVVKHVMDMLHHTDNEFTMLDYERKKQRELFPALPTTEEKLLMCDDHKEVLFELANSFNENSFSSVDVMVYWRFLCIQMKKKNSNKNNQEQNIDKKSCKIPHQSESITSIMSNDVINNITFQRLVFETFANTQHFLTRDLSKLFLYIISIDVPTDSFVFKHVLKLIKDRINEFFPEDVAICLHAIQSMSMVPQYVEVFENGLLLHFENQLNNKIFHQSLSTTPSCNYILEILNSKCFKAAKEDTKQALITACNVIFTKDIRKTMTKHRCLMVMQSINENPNMSNTLIAKHAKIFFNKNKDLFED